MSCRQMSCRRRPWRGDQHLATPQAAHRNVGDGARVRITKRGALRVLGNLDYLAANRFRAAIRQLQAPVSSPPRPGHGRRFNDPSPSHNPELGKVVAGSNNFGVGQVLGDPNHLHGSRTLACAGAELLKLPFEVSRARSRQTRILRMAVAVCQMTSDASPGSRAITLRHDARHQRMLIRKPIRRMHRIVDLRLRIALRTARNLLEHTVVRLARIGDPGAIRTIGPLGSLLCARQSGQKQQHRHYSRTFHMAPELGKGSYPMLRTTDRLLRQSTVESFKPALTAASKFEFTHKPGLPNGFLSAWEPASRHCALWPQTRI